MRDEENIIRQCVLYDKDNDVNIGGILLENGDIICGECGCLIEADNIGPDSDRVFELLTVLDSWVDLSDEIIAAKDTAMANTSTDYNLEESEELASLLNICYETGDASCRFWEEQVLVNEKDVSQLVDAFTNYSEDSDDSYMEITKKILDGTCLSWAWFRPGSTVTSITTLYV